MQKNENNVNFSSLSELKLYASKNKQPSPEFRDLGETSSSNASAREYMIECRCMGASATATAMSKQEARALAAEKVLSLLTSDKQSDERKKPSKRVAKPTKRRSTNQKVTKKPKSNRKTKNNV